jgi:uncharacterized integral membrane protein
MLEDNQSRQEWVRGWRREARRERRNKHHFNMGKGPSILAGLFLLAIGAVLISRNVGVDLPDWLFKWPMIPIVIGLFIGISNGFRDMGWLVVSGVGFFFLADDIWQEVNVSRFVIPGIIVLIGLVLITRPFRRRDVMWDVTFKATEEDKGYQSEGVYTIDKADQEELIDVVSVFGNVKKNIFSKTFRGGEVVCVFGGAEINLTQADFNGKMTIEVVQVFGGTKLIIPPHWQVHSGDTVAVFGGIEDKRKPMPPGQEPERILILKGFTLFGGLEIKSY